MVEKPNTHAKKKPENENKHYPRLRTKYHEYYEWAKEKCHDPLPVNQNI